MTRPPQTDYLTSQRAIADAFSLHAETVAKLLARSDFPPRTRRGWPRAAVEGYVIAAKQRAAAQQAGPNADVKREKLLQEVERIKGDVLIRARDLTLRDMAIAEGKARLIPAEDHLREIAEVGQLIHWFAEQFVTLVSAECRDKRQSEIADRLQKQMLAKLRDKIAEVTEGSEETK